MTLLIRNVNILGSDQKLPEKLDVFVSGDRITALGRFPGKKADEVIEGQGCYLAPGFIDIQTASDHYLSIFTNPAQEDFIKQGVTTIAGGFCGASLAPLIYGSLESVEEWTTTKQINVDWHSVGEFLTVLTKRRLGVNFLTLVGHATVRQAIISGPPRNLTKNELAIFEEILKKSLKEGAFGLSTGLGYVASRETPYQELKALGSITRDAGGFYATHLRDETDDLQASVEETIKLTTEIKSRTMISHLLPVEGYERNYEAALRVMNDLPEEVDLHFSLYPSSVRILKLYAFLPKWAQKDDFEVMRLSLRDEWLRSKMVKDLPKVDPKNFVVAQAPGNDSLVGYSLADLKKVYSLKTCEETLMKLMLTTNLYATVFYKSIAHNLIRQALQSSRSLVASNAASFRGNTRVKVLKPERATATFTKFLKLVQEEKILTLEAAIQKITAEPARKIGLIKRGVIKDGYFADLTGFKGDQILFVVVNGRVAFRDGNVTEVLGGQVLRKS
ncbi:MAG: hypothetical protein HY093_00615 [Candidatus Liptonbacteria bacterium]|nr:hypothetical protein [Candidatus Liptonbacteria bacterium]